MPQFARIIADIQLILGYIPIQEKFLAGKVTEAVNRVCLSKVNLDLMGLARGVPVGLGNPKSARISINRVDCSAVLTNSFLAINKNNAPATMRE